MSDFSDRNTIVRPELNLHRQLVQILVAGASIQSHFLSPDFTSEPSWLKPDLNPDVISHMSPYRKHPAPEVPSAVAGLNRFAAEPLRQHVEFQ
jgi:hypothetical protein